MGQTMSSNERQAQLEAELLRCAEYGNFGRVRELVEIERVNVNCVSRVGMTPLMWAAWAGHFRIVRFLLDKDADLHAADNNGWTALSGAVRYGHVPMAQLLLESGANYEIRFLYGTEYSLLGYAIYKEMVDMVALLLRFRANTHETFYGGRTYTAVYLACWKSNIEIVQLLIDHEGGANVNAFIPRDNDSNVPALSPLCQACKRNNREMVQLLVQQHGARVIYNGVYPDVPCPMKHAVYLCSLELLRFLLDHSRFLEPANQENAQVPEVAGDNHPLSVPLEATIEGNKLEAAQLLVNRGANVNDKPFLWQCANYEPIWTPLRDSHIGIVRLLLRAAGANVNLLADNDSGETPLWVAAKNGHVEMVKELLKARANVRIRDNNNGETPLGVAHRQGHKGIVYLLLRTSPHVWRKLAVFLVDTPPANE